MWRQNTFGLRSVDYSLTASVGESKFGYASLILVVFGISAGGASQFAVVTTAFVAPLCYFASDFFIS